VPEVAPPGDGWARIEAALARATRSAEPRVSVWHSVAFWRSLALGTSALAAACLAALIYVGTAPVPAPLLARLDAESGQAGFVAAVSQGGATLTIVPGRGTTILGVETYSSDAGKALNREFEALTEQRRRLEDRLQALETRETIFTSAAKAQSGKAPRKTKANPDPMQSIRQGTDFAIAQLEAVYTARRRTLQEFQRIDARLGATKNKRRSAEELLRITVTPPRGSVTLRYATAERGWQPHYNLHLTGDGSARLQLSARVTANTRGRQVTVSTGTLAESATAETFPVQPGGALLASYHLPLTEEKYTEGLFNNFSGTLTNTAPHYLQPGESGLFRRGTYMGRFRFEGMSSGRSRVISYGK